MSRPAVLVTLLLIVSGVGLALRLPRLDLRPVHCDEAVHAYKFNELLTTGRYVYDLNEFHGPTLYYLTLPIAWLQGAGNWTATTITTYRVVPVIAGVALILLLLLLADGLGRGATSAAAILTCVSPALVFYSRYYIQEMLLVTFTLLAIGAGWRYVHSGRVAWLLLAGAAVGLMHATKETCIITLGALCCAGVATVAYRRGVLGEAVTIRPRLRTVPIMDAFLVASFVSILLFSAFFTNLAGPPASIAAYGTYFDRAGGSGVHEHPWDYYLRVLFWTWHKHGPLWTEAFIAILAVIGTVGALRPQRPDDPEHRSLLTFLVCYTFVLFVIYSAIPYKTPWCALSPLHGMVLLAGYGVVVVWRKVRRSTLAMAAAVVLLTAGTGHLGVQAWRASLDPIHSNSPRNPHVYANTVSDARKLTRFLERVAAAHAADEPFVVKVYVENSWPLPWYLRRLAHVGYWPAPPADADGSVVVASTDYFDTLAERLVGEYHLSHYGLRRDEQLLVYVHESAWEAFVAAQRTRAHAGRPQP